MTDHETYLLLAAKQISESLTTSEEAELDAHLATCPSCRSFTAAMRRDDILLRGQLGEVAVAPRVRQRVMEEAAGRRRFDPRLILALAATLLVASIGIPLIAGSFRQAGPTPQAIASVESAAPTASAIVSDPSSPPSTPEPSVSLPPTPSPGTGPFVAAAYTYDEGAPRRDSVAAHFEGGSPVGEWTRTQPPIDGSTWAGPVTCLMIDGNDAWLAGPATTSADPTTVAAFVHLHDGGPDGEGDMAILWRSNAGQTLTTLEGWCRLKFVPGGPFPITSGDIVVDDGNASPSP